MHDHITSVNCGSRLADLMFARFGHILGAMVAYCAPRHGGLRVLVVCSAAALLGCAGKTDSAVANAGAAGMQVDPTRCDAKGKNVVVADTNQDKKPDVTKMYETRDVGGQKTQI